MAKVLKAQRRQPASGVESLLGQPAIARSELNPQGKVLVQGELWDAELRNAAGPAPIDAHLVVVAARASISSSSQRLKPTSSRGPGAGLAACAFAGILAVSFPSGSYLQKGNASMSDRTNDELWLSLNSEEQEAVSTLQQEMGLETPTR